MGDIVLKRLQVGTEGPFSTGATLQPTGSISVYGAGGLAVPATRRMAVEDASEFGYQELTWQAPEEARGTYAATYQHLLQMRMAKGKFSALFYPDDTIWWMRAAVSGSPVVTTLPTAPPSLLAATAIAASLSLTSQPNVQTDQAVAKILLVTLANSAAQTTAVTVTIAGTAVGGAALTEVLNFSAGTTTPSLVAGGGAGALTVTLATKNYFATVNASGITTSAQPVGDTVAVTGINAWKWVFTPDMASSTLDSLTGEFFDGSTAWQLPGLVVPKFDFTFQIGKTVGIAGDALCRDMLNVTLASLTDAVLAPASTYAARYYSDPQGTAPGTTQVNARLLDGSLGIENQLAVGKAADGTPFPNWVGRKRYKTKVDMTLLFNSGVVGSEDPADFNAFQAAYSSRTVMVALPCVAYLPCGPLNGVTLAASNWPTQLADTQPTPRGGLGGAMLAHTGKFTVAAPANAEGRLAVKLTHDMEVDLVSMGAAYQVTVVSRVNPNMV